MDLEKLQKKGAVHIGLKTGRKVLYAYVLESRPSHVAVGWTAAGVTRTPDGPLIREVVDRASGPVRFLMICHHSSSKELVSKIRDGMTVKGLASVAPEGVAEAENESWFKAGFDEVVFAYPPFAKIFLSEVPSFAEEREDLDADEGADRKEGRAGLLGLGRSRERSAEEEEEAGFLDVLLKSERSRSVLSFILLMGIIVGSFFAALEQIKSTEGGRAWLLRVEQATGLSLGAEEGRGYGFLTKLERERRAQGETRKGEFTEWYDPARSDDAGSTFGLPKEHNGFRIKTWVDGEPGDRHLYAAYRFNPGVTWQPETTEQAALSRRLMGDLVRAPDMANSIHEHACKALSGTASLVSDEEFEEVDVLVVNDTEILIAFRADESSCESGVPTPLPFRR